MDVNVYEHAHVHVHGAIEKTALPADDERGNGGGDALDDDAGVQVASPVDGSTVYLSQRT